MLFKLKFNHKPTHIKICIFLLPQWLSTNFKSYFPPSFFQTSKTHNFPSSTNLMYINLYLGRHKNSISTIRIRPELNSGDYETAYELAIV